MTDETLFTPPPFNLEAEQAVLGALLIDPDAILKIDSFLAATDFHVAAYGWVYGAIQALTDRGIVPDIVTLCDELRRRGQLDEIGGAGSITALINATPSALRAEHYAHIVERTSVLRKLIRAAGKISELAYSDSEDLDSLIDQAERALFEVTQRNGISADIISMQTAVPAYRKRIQELYEAGGKLIGLPTGFPKLDRMTNGLQGGCLYLVAGRPGMGKSALVQNIAYNLACKDKHIGVFSLEMSANQLINRWTAGLMKIDSHRLGRGGLTEKEWPDFIQATGELEDLPIHLDESAFLTISGMRSKGRKLATQGKLDLLVIDYLQLMDASSPGRASRVQEVAQISRGMKMLSMELDIPLLIVSQLNRAVEGRSDKHPVLSDLRDSGTLEQDADVVMFLYRDDYYFPETATPGITDLDVAKQRSGPIGRIPLMFNKETTSFTEVDLIAQEPPGFGGVPDDL